MAVFFGYKKSNGIVRPVKFDPDVPSAIQDTFFQCREIDDYEAHMSLSSLEEKYPYKPEIPSTPETQL